MSALPLIDEQNSPRATSSLASRRDPLVPPVEQLRVLSELPTPLNFNQSLRQAGWESLRPTALEYFQINLGRLCNMTCRHCHVDAGPDRVRENMDRELVDACLAALDQTPAHTVDITGGAPELNPHFRYLVEQARNRRKHVIDRCNLTILLAPKMRDLPAFLAEHEVEVVCSLPHFAQRNTDAQRGEGTFERSLRALRLLNEHGYGQGDPRRRLTLMANPAGAFLAGDQSVMERDWKRQLERRYGITFDRLLCLNNMPIARFLEWLLQSGNLEAYMERLVNAFNPAAIDGVMCRNTLSISWDGYLYDCDFNQMLDLKIHNQERRPMHVRDFNYAALRGRQVLTHHHCYGCTAGAGSSCGGATT